MNKKLIIDILDNLGFYYKKSSDNYIMISCPLAEWNHDRKTDRKPSMAIYNIDKEGISTCFCFACKHNSSFSGMLLKYQKLSGKDISKHIKEVKQAEEISPEYVFSQKYEEEKVIEKEKTISESYIKECRKSNHEYLIDRGFTYSTLNHWEIGFDKERNYITIPIRDINNVLVGVTGRRPYNNIEKNDSKYKNFNFKKGNYLLGENKNTNSKGIIVEGPLDAIKLWQYCNNRFGVVSTFGSGISFKQSKKIVRLFNEVVIFYDNDSSGKTGTEKAIKYLRDQILVKKVLYPMNEFRDVDKLVDTSPNIIEKMISEAEIV